MSVRHVVLQCVFAFLFILAFIFSAIALFTPYWIKTVNLFFTLGLGLYEGCMDNGIESFCYSLSTLKDMYPNFGFDSVYAAITAALAFECIAFALSILLLLALIISCVIQRGARYVIYAEILISLLNCVFNMVSVIIFAAKTNDTEGLVAITADDFGYSFWLAVVSIFFNCFALITAIICLCAIRREDHCCDH